MTEEKGIADATAVQAVIRRHLESEHGNKLVEVRLRKCWFSSGVTRDVWEAEGTAVIKKGLLGKEQQPFKYQIDPASGAVIGFEFEEQNDRG
jgi:hypothetical protein